jgi:hypothetical protein
VQTCVFQLSTSIHYDLQGNLLVYHYFIILTERFCIEHASRIQKELIEIKFNLTTYAVLKSIE